MPWPFDNVPLDVALKHTMEWFQDGLAHPLDAVASAMQHAVDFAQPVLRPIGGALSGLSAPITQGIDRAVAPAAQAIDNTLRPIEEPINALLNSNNPASQIASGVLATGGHVGTNGSGAGMQASPRPVTPSPYTDEKINAIANAARDQQGPPSVSFPTVNAPTVGPSNSVGMTPIDLNGQNKNIMGDDGKPLVWNGKNWDYASSANLGVTPVTPTLAAASNVGPTKSSQVSQTYGPLDSRFTTDAQWKEFLRAPNSDGYTTSQAQGLYNEWKANHPQVNVNSQNPMKPGYSDTAPPNQAAQNPGPPVNPNGTSKGSGSGGGDGTPPGPPAGMDPSLWALLLGTGGSAAATYFAAKMQADAAKEAAAAQVGAANNATELQKGMFKDSLGMMQTQFDKGQENIKPWIDAGKTALPQLQNFDQTHPLFSSLKNDWKTVDDGYNFRFNEGMKALQNSAAARGGIMAGNTGKALQQYGQDMASQEYNNAFNRYQTERGGQLNALQSLAGTGQSAVQQSNAAGSQYANNAASLGQSYANSAGANMTGAGAATAAGIQGAGNANASGYAGYGNILSSAMSEYNKRIAGQEQNALTKSLFGKG